MSSASPKRRARPCGHLPEPGQAGGNGEAVELMRREMLVSRTGCRAAAYERHVAAEHVDELRQLVQARPAEPAAERSDRVRPGRACTGRCSPIGDVRARASLAM